MSAQTIGIIVGGILPALFFGIGTALQRASSGSGIAASFYLMNLSLGFLVAAMVLLVVLPDRTFTMRACGYAALNGVVWGGAYSLMMYGLSRYEVPVSKLIPLVNMNTLVAVLLAFWIFSEWKDVHVAKLLVGSALVVAGGTLVATS